MLLKFVTSCCPNIPWKDSVKLELPGVQLAVEAGVTVTTASASAEWLLNLWGMEMSDPRHHQKVKWQMERLKLWSKLENRL